VPLKRCPPSWRRSDVVSLTVDQEVENLATAIGQGLNSQAVRARLQALESEQQSLTQKIRELEQAKTAVKGH
jgi:hypothetical protein